jgi:hypothetical protein
MVAHTVAVVTAENADITAGDGKLRTKQSFEWFLDMATSTGGLQVLKITCGGKMVKQRLAPFFQAYKYYKLGSVSIRMIPASTLPVDPTGLSYEAGENTVDPRDQFNPGLVRITNGEDFYDSDEITQTSIAEAVYNNMLLDQRWYKFNLQSGMKRTAYPRFWQVGQLHQDSFPGATVNLPTFKITGGTPTFNGTESIQERMYPDVIAAYRTNYSDPRGLFQTGTYEPMGWMPTDAYYATFGGSGYENKHYPGYAPVPEVELMKIILPKAYKTKFFYRIYVEETVYFKDPVAIGVNEYAGLDRFVRPNVGLTSVAKPTESWSTTRYTPTRQFDNYGGDYS